MSWFYQNSMEKHQLVTNSSNILNKQSVYLPNSLHIWITFAKTFLEKLTRMSTIWRSGSCSCTVLCIGVNSRRASAWTPYWSSVERVRTNHVFLSGHQRAWSDQSIAISEKQNKTMSKFIHLFYYNNIGNYMTRKNMLTSFPQRRWCIYFQWKYHAGNVKK